jgi:hypothetical protein
VTSPEVFSPLDVNHLVLLKNARKATNYSVAKNAQMVLKQLLSPHGFKRISWEVNVSKPLLSEPMGLVMRTQNVCSP